MTEAEAKTRPCPMMFGWVRHVEDQPYALEVANCIGSACMAWRVAIQTGLRHPIAPQPDDPVHGYCGLAGKP